MTTLYGIPNCDKIKKTRKIFDANGTNYEFHDYKKLGIDKNTLKVWVEKFGWEKLINQRGTTWRALPDSAKANLTNTKAITLMTENTSLIKRPIIVTGKTITIGELPQ